MTMPTDPALNTLFAVGRLLDEAVDLADAAGEPLIAAHIAQALHATQARIVRLRADTRTVDPDAPERP